MIISPNPFHNALITNSKLPSHNVIFSIYKKIPSQNATRPFQSIKMTFCTSQLDALPCPLEPPNKTVREKEGHALPNTFKTYWSVWKGMPFYALLYHIGARKGMEGHQDIYWGHFNNEGQALPNTTLFSSVWKDMPFFALPYLIGLWKGMEGHQYIYWRAF